MGCHFLLQGNLPDPGIKPRSPTFQADALTSELPGKPKKIRDTKGTFSAKMSSKKDRNGMDRTEAEDIRRGGKNMWKNCTKKIITQITMMM